MMKSAFMKKTVVAVVLFAMITAGAFAQAIPGGFASPQSAATQGRLRSNADDFIRPDAYTNVSFERWYSMASFASTSQAALGYATKIGGLYLGTFYSGSFWANANKPTYSERTVTGFGGGGDKKVPVYTTGNDDRDAAIGTDAAGRPANQIAVLVGVADMGFRLSFRTTYESFKTDEARFGTAAAGDDYKSFETAQGLLSPQLAWSMTKNLAEKGIKPWATIDVNFNRDWTKSQLAASGSNLTVGRSMNNIAPELNVCLGGYTLANNNGWRTSADLEYRLQMTLYNNEYNSGTAIKEFKGTNDNGTLNEQSFMGHRIRPSISTQWNGEKLRLRAKLDLNVILNNTATNRMDEVNGSLVKAGGDSSKVFSLQFNPDLALAAQYQATSKLFLNAGGRVNLAALNRTTTEGSTYDATGTETPNSSFKTVSTAFGSLSNQFTLGVTLNATDNLSIEAATGVSNTAGNNVNVFETGNTGLFNFSSILVTLKF